MGFLLNTSAGHGADQPAQHAPVPIAPDPYGGGGGGPLQLPPQPIVPGGGGYQPPIMNGPTPLHPMDHVAELLGTHANVLRQRLLAAHLQNGLAPEDFQPGQQRVSSPLDIVHQTRAKGSQNLAQLLARFHGGSV